MGNRDGNEAWIMLRARLQQSMKDHIPTKRQRNHDRPAWLSTEILRAVRRKKKLWQKAKHGEQV